MDTVTSGVDISPRVTCNVPSSSEGSPQNLKKPVLDVSVCSSWGLRTAPVSLLTVTSVHASETLAPATGMSVSGSSPRPATAAGVEGPCSAAQYRWTSVGTDGTARFTTPALSGPITNGLVA